MGIAIDDPRRQVPVCRQLHTAIGEHRIVFERYRDGLLFTLDGVIEAKDKPDADYLIYREEVVWQSLVPDFDLEDAMAEIMRATEDGIDAAGQSWEKIIPYMSAVQLVRGYGHLRELNEHHIGRIRKLKVPQAMRACFGFRNDGKPFTKSDKVLQLAAQFGVGVRTIWRDLQEESADMLAAKCPSPNSPDERHTWTPCTCERKCRHCGTVK